MKARALTALGTLALAGAMLVGASGWQAAFAHSDGGAVLPATSVASAPADEPTNGPPRTNTGTASPADTGAVGTPTRASQATASLPSVHPTSDDPVTETTPEGITPGTITHEETTTEEITAETRTPETRTPETTTAEVTTPAATNAQVSTSPGGHAAPSVEAAGAPTATIAPFDCASASTSVTLDNSTSEAWSQFHVSHSRWQIDRFEDTWSAERYVGPGTREVLDVPLIRDAYNRVTVSGSSGMLADREGTCGSYTADPRAVLQNPSCTDRQATVLLDNTRSTEPLGFFTSVHAWGPLRAGSPSTDLPAVTVPAASSRLLVVPLFIDARNTVQVRSGPPYKTILSEDVICGEFFSAQVSPFDCEALTADVTLDNTHRSVATEFITRVGDGDIVVHSVSTVVEAKERAVLTVPLTQDARNAVSVSVTVAADRAEVSVGGGWGECGNYVSDPRAAIGAFSCSTLRVPVTLDNSRSSASAAFYLWVGYHFTDHWVPAEPHRTVVGAGAVETVTVPIRDNTMTRVQVTRTSDDWTDVLASATGPVCGTLPMKAGVSLGAVDCVRGTVPVTIDNSRTTLPPRANLFAVTSTEYPRRPTAFHAEVEVPAGQVRTIAVPWRQLLGGRIRVAEQEEQVTVIYESAMSPTCAASASGGPSVSSTSMVVVPGGNQPPLASTGTPGAMLATVGMLLLGSGVLTIRLAGRGARDRRH